MAAAIQPGSFAEQQHERFPEAYSVLRAAIAGRVFPGCAFGLLQNGRILLSDALGNFTYESQSAEVTPGFTYESQSAEVTPGTMYDIASVTKVVATTAVAMLLYQRGKLDLELPLGELLPGFVIGREDSRMARQVTLRHLLAHNSGLPGYVPFFHTATTPYAVLRGCLQLPIEAQPGTRAEYSDPGFILLGKALEAILGESLPTFAHREIYTPLGMEHTGYCPPPSLRPSIPPTEDDELFRQRRIQGEVQDEHAYLLKGAGGHAGLFSNVHDLLRFSQAVLGQSKPEIFDPATVSLFAQRQPPDGSSRALGWDTPSGDSSSGHHFSLNSIGHLGYSGCSLWIDLDASLAIVLLTNRTWPHRESQVIRDLRPKFHDAIRQAL